MTKIARETFLLELRGRQVLNLVNLIVDNGGDPQLSSIDIDAILDDICDSYAVKMRVIMFHHERLFQLAYFPRNALNEHEAVDQPTHRVT